MTVQPAVQAQMEIGNVQRETRDPMVRRLPFSVQCRVGHGLPRGSRSGRVF